MFYVCVLSTCPSYSDQACHIWHWKVIFAAKNSPSSEIFGQSLIYQEYYKQFYALPNCDKYVRVYSKLFIYTFPVQCKLFSTLLHFKLLKQTCTSRHSIIDIIKRNTFVHLFPISAKPKKTLFHKSNLRIVHCIYFCTFFFNIFYFIDFDVKVLKIIVLFCCLFFF